MYLISGIINKPLKQKCRKQLFKILIVNYSIFDFDILITKNEI